MNGTLIRQTRKAKRLTQQQLAEQAGTVQSVVAELETGTRNSASIATVKNLAAVLELTVDALLSEPEDAARAVA